MKSIVFVIEALHLGGAERSLVTLLQSLDYSKYNVDLVTIVEGGFFKDLVPKEVNWIVVKAKKISLYQRIKYLFAKKITSQKHPAQLLWPIIKENYKHLDKQYDVAIAYSQGFSTYYVEKYIQAPVKYSWLNTDYEKAGYNIAFDFPIYKNFTHVVMVSPEVRAGFEHVLTGVGELDLQIVQDITDKDFVQKLAKEKISTVFSKEKISIVTACRLVQLKGLHLAIDACEILKNKRYDIEWFVIGEGSERSRLEKLINAKQLNENFKLLGAHPNPYPYMANADIYVQSSLVEGWGLTVIEASFLNKPIVCTNFLTASSIIDDGQTGLLAEMTGEDIAKKIERLINNPELPALFQHNLRNKESVGKQETLDKIEKLLDK